MGVLMALSLPAGSAVADTYTVTQSSDNGTGQIAGTLSYAIVQANANPNSTINFNLTGTSTIALSGPLRPIEASVTINGAGTPGLTIDGGGLAAAFFVNSGTVRIENLAISNANAVGGAGGLGAGGGGGGLGAGGALFVGSSANVTIQNVTFDHNKATGGIGGQGSSNNRDGGGGGGGFHGAGGTSQPAGGGGGGFVGNGGEAASGLGGGGGGGGEYGNGGSSPSSIRGGSGGGGTDSGQNGSPSSSNNGAAGGGTSGGNGATFLGAAATSGTTGGGGGGGARAANAGNGGLYGGGGGAGQVSGASGAGGDFGGGGGAGSGNGAGGAGGFGGGGGGASNTSGAGSGGFGAGSGGAHSNGGNGGSGYGGAVFVRSGGTLTIIDSGIANSSVTRGNGGGSNTGSLGANGSTAGAGIYAMSGTTTNLQVDAGTQTYADAIAGSGGITKTGSGALNLTGANAYVGDTDINAGRLAVNGSVASNVNVASGAALGGSGTVTGDVNNSGTVGAGNSIGTLSIVGNFNSLAGSTTEVEIAPGGNTPGVHQDLIAVNGIANLNGNGTVAVVATPGAYSAGTTYTFLSTTGGINGTFAGITDDLAMFNAVLLYNPFHVSFQLVANGTDFAALGLTPNQQAVGMYLDSIFGAASGDLGAFVTALGLGTAADIQNGLTQLQGQMFATLPTSQLQLTSQNLQMLRNQLVFAPACRGGETATGWMRGYGSGADNDADSNAAGYHLGIGGTEVAVQRCLDEGIALGAFGNFGWSTLRLDGLAERATINSNQFGFYYQEVVDRAYLLGLSGFGFQDGDVTRTLSVATAQGQARSNLDGWQHFDYFELGGRLNSGRWELRPFVAGQYIYYRQNGTVESGPTPVNLAVGGQDINSYRTFVGAALGAPLKVLTMTVAPQLRMAWMHEYGDAVYQSQAALIGAGGAGAGGFMISGARAGRDFIVVGTGLNIALNSQASLTLGYDAQLNERQAYHTGSGGLQYVW
jgi:uncharacterized protein with beta-barrel porin domain